MAKPELWPATLSASACALLSVCAIVQHDWESAAALFLAAAWAVAARMERVALNARTEKETT